MRVMVSRRHIIFFSAICASILLSLWINIRETVINPDAICYLMAAEEFARSGLSATLQYCPQSKWPFYSMLIYGVTWATHFSYPLSAYLLDGGFTLVSVILFLKIIKELGGTERVLWFAAAVILLSHEFNSVRQYIVRDHGFWAFYLLSLFALLRYARAPSLLGAFAFSVSLLIATLFRIEGAIFLLALPLLTLFFTDKKRLPYFLQLNVPIIFIGLVLVSWLLLHPQQSLNKLGRVGEVVNQFQHGVSYIAAQYQGSKLALIQHVLSPDAARDAGLVLCLVLVMTYLLNVIGNLSWIYSALLLFAWRGKAAPFNRTGRLVLAGYLLVNLCITLSFFAQHWFLSKRYLIAFSLIFMLWVPFALDKLYEQRAHLKYKIALLLSALFIFVSSLGGIFDFGPSKAYVHEAGDWVHAHVPSTASLYVNDYQLMYYTQHFKEDLFQKLPHDMDVQTIAQGKWKNYDYLALRTSRKEDAGLAAVLHEISFAPLKTFKNKRGDQVVVYQVKENRP